MDGTGRVALVTGAASGIGRATALLLAERAWDVVGVDLADGTDVRDANAMLEAVADVERHHGRLDAVVAAAALAGAGAIDEMPEDTWTQIVDVALRGSTNACRAAVPALRRAGGGAIVLFGSTLGRGVLPGYGAYASAKAGVEGLTRALAVDHASDGIRVNCVVPGSTDTPMMWLGLNAAGIAETRAQARTEIPLGRVAEPAEIARVVAFLISEEASYVTGTSMVVDGGVLARLGSRV